MSPRAWLRSRKARIALAGLALAASCAVALLLLIPSQPGPPSGEADPARYLQAERVAEAEGLRSDLRLLLLVGLTVEFGVLAFFAARRPAWLRRTLDRLDGRRVWGALGAGAVLSLLLALAGLPFGVVRHDLFVDAGLSVQSFGLWLWDVLRGNLITAAFAAIGALILLTLQRRLPRAWWAAGAGVVVAYAFVTSFLAPVVIAPVFNEYEPLPEGPLRTEVLTLADRAGVEVGEVYSVDASSRSTTLNAAVAGLGSTRRVILYDNLIETADEAALSSVVAHELGHVAADDILRGIAFVALVAPAGLLLAREIGDAIGERTGVQPGTASGLPAYALPIMLLAFAVGIAGNVLSRAVEERADRFAIELTEDPDGLVDLQVEIAERNLSDPRPPGWYRSLFSTHPTTAERLGIAEAYGATDVGGREFP
jgi:STE24 endopeptidase